MSRSFPLSGAADCNRGFGSFGCKPWRRDGRNPVFVTLFFIFRTEQGSPYYVEK